MHQSSYIINNGYFISPKQIHQPLLCSDCEKLFNINGENWVIPQSATLKQFPLQTLLKREKPTVFISNRGGIEANCYQNISGVEYRKLGYFAISILWRFLVTNWVIYGKSSRNTVVPSGDMELMRKFLLLQSSTLNNIFSIKVTISSLDNPNISACFPTYECNSYFLFHILGISYEIFYKSGTQQIVNSCCIQGRKRIFMSPDQDLNFTQALIKKSSFGSQKPKFQMSLTPPFP